MTDKERDNRLYIEIGLNISRYRTNSKPIISQEKLADRCGLTRTSIVHIEKGRQRLPIDRLFKIAEALNIDITQLLPQKRNESKIDPASSRKLTETTKFKIKEIIRKHKGET